MEDGIFEEKDELGCCVWRCSCGCGCEDCCCCMLNCDCRDDGKGGIPERGAPPGYCLGIGADDDAFEGLKEVTVVFIVVTAADG